MVLNEKCKQYSKGVAKISVQNGKSGNEKWHTEGGVQKVAKMAIKSGIYV